MFSITGNNIKLTRGDTAKFKVSIKDKNNVEYLPSETDRLSMTVKKIGDYSIEAIVFSKKALNCEFVILSKDTASLNFGDYIYDIELALANGDINTIIPASVFTILEEIHQ